MKYFFSGFLFVFRLAPNPFKVDIDKNDMAGYWANVGNYFKRVMHKIK